jgi:hypothetical protein
VYSQTSVHERLGSWTIRFTNKFSEHKASRMTYCVSCYEHASLEHRGAISWEYQYFISSPPSTYAVNSPPYRHGKTKLSFRLYLICLVSCLSFFVKDLMVSIVLRTCAKSTVVKVYVSNHLVSRNGLIHFTLIPMGKIVSVYGHFGLRTTFMNELSSWTEVWLYVGGGGLIGSLLRCCYV